MVYYCYALLAFRQSLQQLNAVHYFSVPYLFILPLSVSVKGLC